MWPVFIISQCLICLVFFFAGTLYAGNLAYIDKTKAGLDSFYLFGYEYPAFDMRLYTETKDDACDSTRFQIWRWWTYQFSHIGISHVLTNVFLLVVLGIPMEGLHGSLKLFFMFQIGVIGGAWCCLANTIRYPVCGMSGGCYALFGMHLADLLLNWKHRMFRKLMLLFLMVVATGSFVVYIYGNPDSENVSNEAHLGGAIAGLCIATFIGQNIGRVTRLDRFFQTTAVLVAICCSSFSLYQGFQMPPKSIWDDTPGWCWLRQVWNPIVFNCARDATESECGFRCVFCGEQSCIDDAIRDFKPTEDRPSWQADMKIVDLSDCVSELPTWNARTYVDEGVEEVPLDEAD
jgi:membrane associated rhomboid family serine protease